MKKKPSISIFKKKTKQKRHRKKCRLTDHGTALFKHKTVKLLRLLYAIEQKKKLSTMKIA